MEFIYECENFLPVSLCAELIEKFESHHAHHIQGQTTNGYNGDVKRSTDLQLTHTQSEEYTIERILKFTSHIPTKYLEYLKDNGLDNGDTFKQLFERGFYVTPPQLQKTKTGEFFRWHSDDIIKKNSRLLTFIIYLNDVEEGAGGTTDFLCGKSVRPETGKLIVFPATWTYIHRGKCVERGTKYILTSFVWSEKPNLMIKDSNVT